MYWGTIDKLVTQGFVALSFYNLPQLSERSQLTLVSSPYHVRFASYMFASYKNL